MQRASRFAFSAKSAASALVEVVILEELQSLSARLSKSSHQETEPPVGKCETTHAGGFSFLLVLLWICQSRFAGPLSSCRAFGVHAFKHGKLNTRTTFTRVGTLHGEKGGID